MPFLTSCFAMNLHFGLVPRYAGVVDHLTTSPQILMRDASAVRLSDDKV